MLRVLLAQLPVPSNPATNVPLAAGYLKAYAHSAGLLGRAQIDILPRALADHASDAALVEAIVAAAPDVLGLSLYTWSSERTLAIAGRARERLPDTLVVVGGPEVQLENGWVLAHPAVDVAVVGEGEQTFAALLAALAEAGGAAGGRRARALAALAEVPGLLLHDGRGGLAATPERAPLPDLSVVPSPYLLGYLELAPGDMLMVEVSRWCPYACSFCLYGRNMGPRLGGRYFPAERVLEELRWGRARGLTRVHFIEANLNLVPPFRALMEGLAELNADGALALYAELRGEHLSEEAADALVRAGLRVAEVGLQTANPGALAAARRRTDLARWAAGARRLYARGVEVLLDVILGLPADDAAGVEQTLAFIERERLGPYDVFMLQALPGTQVRAEAALHGLVFQGRPPYYVLATDRMPYAELRRLRERLRLAAGGDPDAVEGCPPPRLDALALPPRAERWATRVVWSQPAPPPAQLASHIDVIFAGDLAGAGGAALAGWLADLLRASPSTLVDLYICPAGAPPDPGWLAAWRAQLPYQPGYLDRVAVYRSDSPEPGHQRVSPRIWLVLPWVAQAEPRDYAGVAELIWEYALGPGEEPPLGAWAGAGGAGVRLPGSTAERRAALREAAGILIWE